MILPERGPRGPCNSAVKTLMQLSDHFVSYCNTSEILDYSIQAEEFCYNGSKKSRTGNRQTNPKGGTFCGQAGPFSLTHGHEKENVLNCKELGHNSQFQCVVLHGTLYKVFGVDRVI